jgi:Ni/Co efflux regulator RcnB
MRKTVLTIVAACLVAGSSVQLATAAGRHSDRAEAPASERFRNANDDLATPAARQQDLSDYSEGHVISAPAGH